ncbi:MAG: flavin oxidoreductase/NADH oxidase [Clostridiales bacterium]|nr:flavin oxidoreductase/NADH oxidase [Clostridiales bacterium]
MLKDEVLLEGTRIPNRVVIQPMEGCDCLEDGTPSELTIAKYHAYAHSGAGLIWFEANAVCREGRTNPRQMQLTRENLPAFQKLVAEVKELCFKDFGYTPVCILQLTHSGRQSIVPMIAYRNKVYEATRPVTDEHIVTDEYLDTLPAMYVNSALLAKEAGFDGVDIKSCHGYLMQEMLSAFDRPGKYGGSFENRTRLYLTCVREVKKAVPKGFHVVTRLGASDMVEKPCGFGTTEQNEIDLTETKRLISLLYNEGIRLINVTMGNPYFNPHVNRPFRAGAYTPPEKPEVGLQRFWDTTKQLKTWFPDILFIGSGLSFYRENLMEKSESMLKEGVCDLIGYGRVSLAYPMLYRDYLNGNFDAKKCCVACSRCTVLMRKKCVSGCAMFNPYYKNLFNEKCK